MRRFTSFFVFFAFFLGTPAAFSAGGPVSVKIAWDYKDVPAPMKIYELSTTKHAELWDTGTGGKLEDLPVSKEIADSNLSLSPGSKKMFVLVLKNTTAQPLYFFAAPHVVNPPELSLGFKFKCLCINHVYQVAPGQYWYRVVELNMDPSYVGNAVEIKHTLIKVDEARAKNPPKLDVHPSMGHEM
ncbi:MAG: hypothetical protein U1F57_01245 [bacterium]